MKLWVVRGCLMAVCWTASSAWAGLLIEGQLAQSITSQNRYTDSHGDVYSVARNTDVRFLGLGGRYIFENLGFDLLNLEAGASYFLPLQDRAHNTLTMVEGAVVASLNFGPHQPFLGLLYTKFVDTESDPLTFKPALGYQLGYRFCFGEHAVFANVSWRNSKSENPPSVNDQRTTISFWSIGYSYKVF